MVTLHEKFGDRIWTGGSVCLWQGKNNQVLIYLMPAVSQLVTDAEDDVSSVQPLLESCITTSSFSQA